MDLILPEDIGEIVQRGLGPDTYRAREMDPWKDYAETKSGLLVPSHVLKSKLIPTGIDLFSGAGGFSLGFIQAGFEVVAALEWNCECIHTYLTNLGGPNTRIVFIEDSDRQRWEKYREKAIKYQKRSRKEVNKIDHAPAREYLENCMAGIEDGQWGGGWRSSHQDKPPVRIMFMGDARKATGDFILGHLGMKTGDPDCIMGGPPCQGFSTSGKRDVMDPRNSLVFDYARIVCEIKPKTMVMENVPGILSMITPEGLPVIDVLCKILEKGGMGVFDSLKRSLTLSSGSGAIVQGKGTIKYRKNWDTGDEDEEDQTGSQMKMELKI